MKTQVIKETQTRTIDISNMCVLDQKLPVMGQGTISFTIPTTIDTFSILLFDKIQREPELFYKDRPDEKGNIIEITVNRKENEVKIKINTPNSNKTSDPKTVIEKVVKIIKSELEFDYTEDQYWISVNKNEKTIKIGKGYDILEKLVSHIYPMETYTEKVSDSKDKEVSVRPFEKILDTIKYVAISSNLFTSAIKLEVLKYPVEDIPYSVVSPGKVTLNDLDENSNTVPHYLSPECQILYATIAGASIDLECDFKDFAKAINHSILTEGNICYNKLIEKAGEFGKEDILGTYLRITVGKNKGGSPGIPLVLEIWPAGHYSPIHSHSQCNAIIRVLHGEITSQWFSSLSIENQKPFDSQTFKKDDITWLDSRHFQTHKLINGSTGPNKTMCATIQSYMYDDKDNTHYEYFDYIGKEKSDSNTDVINRFDPVSDWDFGEFKELIRKEWEEHKGKK